MSNSCFAPFLHLKSCLNLPLSDHQTGVGGLSAVLLLRRSCDWWNQDSSQRCRKISQMERTRIPPEVNIKRGLWKLTPVSYFCKRNLHVSNIVFLIEYENVEKVTKITSKRQGGHYAKKKKKKVPIFHYFHRIENSFFFYFQDALKCWWTKSLFWRSTSTDKQQCTFYRKFYSTYIFQQKGNIQE